MDINTINFISHFVCMLDNVAKAQEILDNLKAKLMDTDVWGTHEAEEIDLCLISIVSLKGYNLTPDWRIITK